jgi:hypothetical protein
MTHLLANDSKDRDLSYDDAYRAYLVTRKEPSSDYRFDSSNGKRVRARAAVRRMTGYIEGMIESIADSKMRRVQRELDLRGIRYDRPSNDWVSCNSGRAGTRRD